MPKVLPGAGCLESVIAVQFNENPKLQKTLMKLALVPAGLDISETFVDLQHGHLWASSNEKQCLCGLSENSDSMDLVPALEIYTNSLPSKKVKTIKFLPNSHNFIIDSFSVKKDSILLAIETAENLSNIGMILNC